MPKIAELRGDEDIERAQVSRFLGEFDRRCRRLERSSVQWKCVGLVANAYSTLACKRVCLRGITVDASIWPKESTVSCRVGLYKLRQPGKKLRNYFLHDIRRPEKEKCAHHDIRGNGFGWVDACGGFMQNFSRNTDMAVMDYGEIEIVKEEILDLHIGGFTASDNRRIKWDILINGGDGEVVYHDNRGFPSDALYMFSYHLSRNVVTSICYGSMMYFDFIF